MEDHLFMKKTIGKAILFVLMACLMAWLMPSSMLLESWPVEGSLLGHNEPLATIGGWNLRPYGVMMGLGVLLGVGAMLLMKGKETADTKWTAALCVLPCAVLGGHLVYCLTLLSTIVTDYETGLHTFYLLHVGGYTLYGGVLGGVLGLMLAAKWTKRPFAALADALVPAVAYVLFFGRTGELFLCQGLGEYVEEAFFQRLPFAVCTYADEDWSQWQLAVFLYEALIAVALGSVGVGMLKGRTKRDGSTAETFVAMLSITQVMMESLRRDEFIRFGFVRFSQLMAAVTAAVVLVLRIRRVVKEHGWNAWQSVRIGLFAACVGIVVGIEFALDKSPIDNGLLYGVMAVTLAAMSVAVLRNGKKQAMI